MGIAMTQRRDRRFRAHVPLRVLSNNGNAPQTLVPRDISTSACFFDFPQPQEFAIGSYTIELGTGQGNVLRIDKAKITPFPGRGWCFEWNLDADKAATLHSFLETKSNEPLAHSKVLFLNHEQENLFKTILDIDDRKHKGYLFLYALVAAYFVYLSAPLHLITITSSEQAAFYGVGGIWASVMMIFHAKRFLSWLGMTVRRRTLFVHEMSANRAWLFASDGSYYSKTVLPLGTTYDNGKTYAETHRETANEAILEPFPLILEYKATTTLFHFMVQAIFVFGLVLFASIVVRSAVETDLMANGVFRLLDLKYFREVFAGGSILLIYWIQVIGNSCAHYQQLVWEARRIRPQRPNPRFRRTALRRNQPTTFFVFQIGLLVAFLYGTATAIPVIFHRYTPTWLHDHLENWMATAVVLVLFLIFKVMYINVQMEAASRDDDAWLKETGRAM